MCSIKPWFLAGLILTSGCASPYAHRDADFAAGRYASIRQAALADLTGQGQYDVNGRMSGLVSSASDTFDTQYFDLAEEAHSIIPVAYLDLARAALATNRYTDTIQCAQWGVAQGEVFFQDDQWTLLRLLNLMEGHKILYRSYLYAGDLKLAAAHFKQYQALADLVNSKAFKTVVANTVSCRMTSMRLRSDYLDKKHWAIMMQILATMAAAAGGAQQHQGGNDFGAAAIVAAGVAVVAIMEAYKQELKLQLNVDLSGLMATAANLNRLPDPTPADIRRAKVASDLYSLACARAPGSGFDLARLAELRQELQAAGRAVSIVPGKGEQVIVRGNVKSLLKLSRRIDEVPLTLPPPPTEGGDAYLDKYLSPGLYKVAGMRMTPAEQAFLDHLAGQGGEEFVLDLNSPESRQGLNGLRRMMRKTKEFDIWAASL